MVGKKIIVISLVILLIVVLVIGVYYGVNRTQRKIRTHAGNSEEYAVKNASNNPASPLAGKRFLFLGSSVTYGATALGESFVDYLEKEDGIVVVQKEAVSGTTLVTQNEQSYIPRLKALPKDLTIDCFVCQLSTNDASLLLPLGTLSKDEERDESTVIGAIETIIAYVEETWGVPIVFYTGTKYDSAAYQNMVDALYAIGEKREIGIIDLWNDADMNAVSQKEYALYMFDPIHPTRAGYRKWWTPKFRSYLSDYLAR